MKNPELFNKTISILIAAYQNGTLEHYNCYACAVGNIVAANCGYKLVKSHNVDDTDYYTGYNGTLIFSPKLKFDHVVTAALDSPYGAIESKIVIDHIQKTGYSFNELRQIENAFEIPMQTLWDADDHMFYGLLSMCDCLMKIHGGNEIEVQQAKELFVRA